MPYLAPLPIALALGWWCTSAIRERAGEPALPLDDSYIHLQFARRLAEGHWFSYTQGGGYSSGATSMLWPLAIAPFHALGIRELHTIWVVWLLGCLLHAATALETARLTARLIDRAGGLAAGAACLAFAGFLWFTYSGMETMALTWIFARGMRVAAERAEPEVERCFSYAPPASSLNLALTGLVAPLMRPEGAIVSAMAILVALRQVRARRPLGERVTALALPALGPMIIPFNHWVFTGHSASATAMVKWLALDPYTDRAGFVSGTLDNCALLATDLLNGGAWTWLFVPENFAWVLGAGVIATACAGYRLGRPWSAALVILGVLATFGPCTYSTMLWNRVRYIWPFAPAWFAAALCLPAELSAFAARRSPKLRLVGVAAMFGSVAALAVRLPETVADLATSARAIHLQQVALGLWARSLPQGAVIGVNDTGAIAYLSEHKTFDIVGLTTEGEAPFWAEGAGSRFEHYEHMPRGELPTHFIVYPGWMGMNAVLGRWLNEATVHDQSILGGATKVAYEARWDLLGSAAQPVGARGELLDEVDIADLESERAHHYRRGDAQARYDVTGWDFSEQEMADGGRIQRAEDRFVMLEAPAALLVARVRCGHELEVWNASERVGLARVVSTGDVWDERVIELDASAESRWITIRCVRGDDRLERFDSYHYWLLRQPAATATTEGR